MIDVIIPAYNAFETLGLTLHSIVKQVNRDDLKIYIINDGSVKSYEEIINNYSVLLDITEIYIKKSGPGKARQVGLDSSKNEYIVFIDADDTLYDDYSLLNLIKIIPESDLAQGSFIEKSENDSKIMEPQYCYLHGKMYRRSIIEKYNISFDVSKRNKGDIYEDSSFNQLYTLCCDKISTTTDIIYVYEYNPNSLTKSNNNYSKNLHNFIKSMTWLGKQIELRNIQNSHDIAWNFCIIAFHCYFHYFLASPNNNFVFSEMSTIKKIYNKYIDFLSFDEQLELYKFCDYPVIPTISFYEFMDKIQ